MNKQGIDAATPSADVQHPSSPRAAACETWLLAQSRYERACDALDAAKAEWLQASQAMLAARDTLARMSLGEPYPSHPFVYTARSFHTAKGVLTVSGSQNDIRITLAPLETLDGETVKE